MNIQEEMMKLVMEGLKGQVKNESIVCEVELPAVLLKVLEGLADQHGILVSKMAGQLASQGIKNELTKVLNQGKQEAPNLPQELKDSLGTMNDFMNKMQEMQKVLKDAESLISVFPNQGSNQANTK